MSKPDLEPLPEPDGHKREIKPGCRCDYCYERRLRRGKRESGSSYARKIQRQTDYYDERCNDVWNGELEL